VSGSCGCFAVASGWLLSTCCNRILRAFWAVQAHQVAVDAEHNLRHALPRLTAALVHADPQAHPGADHHAALASHR
jgi:hypothetical protein